MDKPLVSICCITYNHESYIRDCLEGFLMQNTNFPFEVIIHDDASTDHTADIIREYEMKYSNIIKPIFQTENQYSKGVRISPTFVFPRVQGKYIAICEGDDYWIDSLKLQKQFDYMEFNKGCSMCCHNVNEIYDNVPIVKKIDFSPGMKTPEDIFKKWCIPTCSTFFRYDAVQAGYNLLEKDKRFMYGDIVMFLAATTCGYVYALDEIMACYRRNIGGVTYKQKEILKRCNHYNALEESFPIIANEIRRTKLTMLYITLFKIILRKNKTKLSDVISEILTTKNFLVHFYSISTIIPIYIKKIFKK